MRTFSLILYSVWTLILLGVLYAMYRLFSAAPSVATVGAALNTINPLNNNNVFSEGANHITQAIVGNTYDSVGTAIYNATHIDENLASMPVVRRRGFYSAESSDSAQFPGLAKPSSNSYPSKWGEWWNDTFSTKQ